jgi:uncharacterized protein (TIGR04255 family)
MSLSAARRMYRRAPLVEAVCEFRFKQAEGWDLTIPGLLYERIRDTFPGKRSWQAGVMVQLGPVPARMDPDRVQFTTPDGRLLVQVAPNLLATNHLAPYSSWASFRAVIGDVYANYRAVDPQAVCERVGLRYINRIVVPAARFQIEEYFTVTPNLPAVMPQEWAGFLIRVEVPYRADESTLLFGLALAEVDPQTRAPAFILDLDFATTALTSADPETIFAWLDRAHDHIEAAFEGALTERARALFEEVAS